MRVLEREDWRHIALEPRVFIMETSSLEKWVQQHGQYAHPSLWSRLWLHEGVGILNAPKAQYKEAELTAELKLELSTDCARNHLVTERCKNL